MDIYTCTVTFLYTYEKGEKSLRHGYIHIYIFFSIINDTESNVVITTAIQIKLYGYILRHLSILLEKG